MLPEADQKQLDICMEFSAGIYRGKYRKHSGLPYFVHPVNVLRIVCGDWGITHMPTLFTALMHDCVEERPDRCTFEDCEIHGPGSIVYMKEITFIPDYDIDMTPEDQKKLYIEAFDGNGIPSLVDKLADRIDNTLDFLLQGGDYPPKYWRKAEPVFRAFERRRKEIDDFYRPFGAQPATKIASDLNMVSGMVSVNYAF